MKLMIVEDEVRLLYNMAYNIPWEQFGIEVVGIAKNGMEALSLIHLRKPDILLLDIEMPGMDGLSLMKALQANGERIHFIVLSGHDDFHFARSALELGADNYLLKPAGNPDITAAVIKVSDDIKEKRNSEHNQQLLQQKWRSNLPTLQHTFLRNLVHGRYSEWEVERYTREYLMENEILHTDDFIVTLLEMDPLSSAETRFTARDASLLQFSLQSIAKEFLADAGCQVFSDENFSTVVLFTGSSKEHGGPIIRRANAQISKLLEIIKDCLKLTASAGIGSRVPLKEISISYRQAHQALHERVLYGYNIVVPYNVQPTSTELPMLDREFERKLQNALVSGDSLETNKLIEAWHRVTFGSAQNLEAVQEQVLFIHSLLTRIIHTQGWSVHDVVGEDYIYFQRPDELLAKEHTLQWVERICQKYIAYGREQRALQSNQLIVSLKDLAEKLMDQEISLYEIADRLYVNSSYLSRLFKRETGQTFTAFYTERKMQKARELLLEGVKVYEAARQVGFKDISYFTKLFRKHWGITPGEVNRNSQKE